MSKSSFWTLHIDCKEPNAQELAKELIITYNIPTTVSDLAIGDYWLTKDGKVWCAIERKTLSDFTNSIISDGRYENQTARLLKSEVPYIFFLVVGKTTSLGNEQRRRIQSAILHLQLNRNLKVSEVVNAEDVPYWLCRLYKYLDQEPTEQQICAPTEEAIQMNCRKRKMDTQKDVFIAQLMCISGISENKAKCIANVYSDMQALMNAYSGNIGNARPDTILKDIQCGKQKLGAVLSERIYKCLYQIPEEKDNSTITKKQK